MSDSRRPIAIYYEHPDWFRPLFAELERRDVAFTRLEAASHCFDVAAGAPQYSLIFNRMSPSAYLRGHGHTIFYTLQYLAHLRRLGVRVINGYDAFVAEISKAHQLSLLQDLGLPYPAARVINHPDEAIEAAAGLRFPIVVKPNIGGSGAGVLRFDSIDALRQAAQGDRNGGGGEGEGGGEGGGGLHFGLDGTALIQEFIPPEDNHIVRVEVLNGHYLYAIRVYTEGDTFNLCPADLCQTVDGTPLERAACPADAPKNGLRVCGYTPPSEVIASVERITTAAGIEVGGVEYVVDDRDGRLYFYDINALSNFVADAPRVIGFDPYEPLVDYLLQEAA